MVLPDHFGTLAGPSRPKFDRTWAGMVLPDCSSHVVLLDCFGETIRPDCFEKTADCVGRDGHEVVSGNRPLQWEHLARLVWPGLPLGPLPMLNGSKFSITQKRKKLSSWNKNFFNNSKMDCKHIASKPVLTLLSEEGHSGFCPRFSQKSMSELVRMIK